MNKIQYNTKKLSQEASWRCKQCWSVSSLCTYGLYGAPREKFSLLFIFGSKCEQSLWHCGVIFHIAIVIFNVSYNIIVFWEDSVRWILWKLSTANISINNGLLNNYIYVKLIDVLGHLSEIWYPKWYSV